MTDSFGTTGGGEEGPTPVGLLAGGAAVAPASPTSPSPANTVIEGASVIEVRKVELRVDEERLELRDVDFVELKKCE